MSVDLDKNRNEIINAWKDVIDSKSNTDWALFGYEGQTNVLKVVSTGSDGLIELTEELNSGKILYGFVNITNDKADLTKYLLINWQGEGAPTVRKGTCANHIRDISKVLAGAHLTLNARTEDDIDSDRILEKLNSIRFAVKENRPKDEDNEPQRAAVGTNYSRVIPSREINSKDRDSFWKKQEEEERKRIEIERSKQLDAKLELDKEQKKREQREHAEREERTLNERNTEENTNGTKVAEPIVKNVQVSMPAVERSTTQAEEMRQQRNQEVRQLIGSTMNTAKALWSQNTAAGQMINKPVKTAPVKPARNSISKSINSPRQPSPDPPKTQQSIVDEIPMPMPIAVNESTSPILTETTSNINETRINQSNINLPEPTPVVEQEQQQPPSQPQTNNLNVEDDDTDPYSTIKRSPYTKTSNSSQNGSRENDKQNDNVRIEMQTAPTNESNINVTEPYVESGNDEVKTEDMIYQNVLQDEGLRARALYDYQADDESEISFDPGDIITHIDQIDEGWWQGLGPDQHFGLFPANYVEILN